MEPGCTRASSRSARDDSAGHPRPWRARGPGHREILRVQRQIGAVVRIFEKAGAPPGLHVVDLGLEARLLLRSVVAAAAFGLVMHEYRVRRPDVAISRLGDAEAEIDVVEGHSEVLVV